MPIDLTALERSVRSRAPELEALAVRWTIKPISPNHGKAVTSAELEGAGWLTSIIAWETGEVELDAGRTADGWLVAKHYDLRAAAEFDTVLAELVGLLQNGTVPADALTSRLSRGQ